MKPVSLGNYIKPFIFISAIIFAVAYLVLSPQRLKDYTECVAYTVSVMSILAWIYIHWGWRLSPWERMPRLANKYSGTIKFLYNGTHGEKKAEISFCQTLISTQVKIKTDEIRSISVAGNIVLENDVYVLYYTYITSPQGMVNAQNPIQRGSCRIELELWEGKNIKNWLFRKTAPKLSGDYWTNRKTTGDIILEEISE